MPAQEASLHLRQHAWDQEKNKGIFSLNIKKKKKVQAQQGRNTMFASGAAYKPDHVRGSK